METSDNQNKPQQIVVTSDNGDSAARSADASPPQKTTDPEFAGGIGGPSQRLVSRTPGGEPEIVSLHFHPRALIHAMDRAFEGLRRLIPAPSFVSLSDGVANCGHIAMLAVQILALLFFLIAGIRMEEPALIAKGIVVLILLGVLQYVAGRFIEAGSPLLAACPAKLRGTALPDSVALLAVVLGIGCFSAFVVRASHTDSSVLWVGIGCLLVFLGSGLAAIHPALLTIALDPRAAAWEEAVGIASFLPRLAVRTAPLAFGIGALTGAMGLLFGTIMVDLNTVNWTLALVFFCESLPLLSYLVFSLCHLALEVARAVLRHAPPGSP